MAGNCCRLRAFVAQCELRLFRSETTFQPRQSRSSVLSRLDLHRRTLQEYDKRRQTSYLSSNSG